MAKQSKVIILEEVFRQMRFVAEKAKNKDDMFLFLHVIAIIGWMFKSAEKKERERVEVPREMSKEEHLGKMNDAHEEKEDDVFF